MKNNLLVSVVMVVLTILPVSVVLGDSAVEKEKYVNSVILLLRTHAQAVRQLSTNDFKYSENLLRHASSIKRTFGLLGPMDWHAAKSATLYKRADNKLHMDAEMFEQLAENSTQAINAIYKAARQELEKGREGAVLAALLTMQKSCAHCHELLPPGTAPQVWELDDMK